MINWQRPTRHYATRVEAPVGFMDKKILRASRGRIFKAMVNAGSNEEFKQLQNILHDLDYILVRGVGLKRRSFN